MAELEELVVAVRARRRQLDSLSGEAKIMLQRAKELKEEIAVLEDESVTLDQVSILLNSLGEERQMAAQAVIEELVTKGLQEIFDSTLSFHITQSTKARAASVDFFIRTTLEKIVIDTPVMEARGGGVAATVGFLLRLVVMLLRTGASGENILVLDETFAHVSDDYVPNVGAFLREIVDKTGVQIIMVTHQREFEEVADTVYRFTTANGETQVQRV